MMKRRTTFINPLAAWLIVLLFQLFPAKAQERPSYTYTNAEKLTMVGKAFTNKQFYHRIDTVAYPDLPKQVKSLLTHSAGLAIAFKTNSTTIAAKWKTSDRKPSANMTAIAFEGLDLYIKKDGKWQFAGVGKPTQDDTETVLVKDMDSLDKECLLYLPLYDEVNNVSIGVDAASLIEPSPQPFKKKIAVYGSSIVQGASASRPGLAYPARLSRETGLNFVNLGVSGNAKMEKAAADMVADVNADAFVLDCIPNASPEEITERTAYLIRTIRTHHPKAPIIMIQTLIREHGYFDRSVGHRTNEQNKMITQQIEKLQGEIDNLYFIKGDELLGKDHEGTTDGTHPNDLGFDRMLQVIKPFVTKIIDE